MDVDDEEEDTRKNDYHAAVSSMAHYLKQTLALELRRATTLVAERQITLNETIVQQKLRLLEEKVTTIVQLLLSVRLCILFLILTVGGNV